MAYQALYRKWRPMRFDDVVGQSHITDTIRSEITSDRLAHAYLFTGTRGTGKTTTAKILSRAVNCISPTDGNPCNECEVCKAILSETCLDVREIDAASNTGVDNIRDIISQINYVATMGKYKVYIIDEVHMLSKGAFNALLKTLEEPPAHVIFILATTELRLIPATILSRCQRFDFKTISISDIVANLRHILSGEGIEATDEALEYVAYLGDGSMRDSLSILDQCLSFSENKLTLEKVTDVVGAVDDKILYEFASDVAKNDTVSALRRFNDCISNGKNFDNIATGLLTVFREIIMQKVNPDSFYVSKSKKERLVPLAESFDVATLTECINTLSECIASFKSFASARVLCECALIRLTTPSLNTDPSSLAARISALENKLATMNVNAVSTSAPVNEAPVLSEEVCIPAPLEDISQIPDASGLSEPLHEYEMIQTSPPEQNGAETNAAKAVSMWEDVKNALASSGKITLSALLFNAKVKEENNILHICIDDPSTRRTLNEKVNRDAISAIVASIVGSDVNMIITDGDTVSYTPSGSDDLFDSISSIGKDFPDNFNLR